MASTAPRAIGDMPRIPDRGDGHLGDPRVGGHHIVRAKGLRHDGRVSAQPALHEMDGADAALQLTDDQGNDDIAREPVPCGADRLGGGDHGRVTALHVHHAGAIEAITFYRRLPGIMTPAQ